jgi:hypothetical protein
MEKVDLLSHLYQKRESLLHLLKKREMPLSSLDQNEFHLHFHFQVLMDALQVALTACENEIITIEEAD